MGEGSNCGQVRLKDMTMDALASCARGTMWTDYEPTPMTREWLMKNGYID